MKLTVEITGWIGAALILGAFAVNIFGILPNTNSFYLFANASGASMVAWNAAYNRSWPAFTLEAIWCCVALFGIFKFLF